MKKTLTVAVLGLTTLLASGAVLAQAKPETLARQRQAAMILQFKYFAPMAGMELGKVPYNAETVKRNAEFLEVLSKMAWDGFSCQHQGIKKPGNTSRILGSREVQGRAGQLPGRGNQAGCGSQGGQRSCCQGADWRCQEDLRQLPRHVPREQIIDPASAFQAPLLRGFFFTRLLVH